MQEGKKARNAPRPHCACWEKTSALPARLRILLTQALTLCVHAQMLDMNPVSAGIVHKVTREDSSVERGSVTQSGTMFVQEGI